MNTNYFYLSDTQFDNVFDKIELLERYPWVGCNFASSSNRPLIIGDSHYATEKTIFSQEAFDEFKDKKSTRGIVREKTIFSQEAFDEFKDKKSTRGIVSTVIDDICKGDSTFRMHVGLMKTFINVTPDNVKDFWSKIAFYNFIQRVMHNSSENPNNDDKKKGWRCLADVVKVLHPTSIIITGIRNWYGLDVLDEIEGVVRKGWFWDTSLKINRVNPGKATIILSDEEIPITIIRHTSQYYNTNAWHDYLMQTDVRLMSYLCK